MNTSADNHDDGSELQAVMGAYFDALLHETVIKSADVKQAVVPEAHADLNPTETTPVVDPLIATMPVVVPDPVDATVESANVCAPIEAPLDQSTAAGDQSVPAYQLIQVGGLTLGIATDAIAEITAIPTTTAAPAMGAPAWALGSCTTVHGVLTVVDTAALLVPNNARPTLGGHMVQLKGQLWALTCDAIGVVLTPDPGQVTWRGAGGKRLWLAGTIRTPTCALLDISELIKLLEV